MGRIRIDSNSCCEHVVVPSGASCFQVTRLIARLISRRAAEGWRLSSLHHYGGDRKPTYEVSFVRDLTPTWWTRLRWRLEDWREARRWARIR
jgi:hypothetical protein